VAHLGAVKTTRNCQVRKACHFYSADEFMAAYMAHIELERKIELLDAEFRRLVKKIDQEYHRVAWVSTEFEKYDNLLYDNLPGL
jgi:hypothetical protein